MVIEKVAETENKLLKRMELKGVISFEGGTPSNDKVRENLAKKYSAKPELVVVKHIYTKFGQTRAEFEANIYSDIEQLKKIEPKQNHPKSKEEKKEEKKEGEAAEGAEEKKEEPKKEEKTEAKEEKKEEKPAEKKEEKAEPEKKEEKPEEKK